MKFAEVLTVLSAGKKVGSAILDEGDYLYMEDGILSIGNDGEYIDQAFLDTEMLGAEDFYEIPTVAEAVSVDLFLNPATGRWTSTTDLADKRRRGYQVKTFVSQT
jgi:hypothetical protein